MKKRLSVLGMALLWGAVAGAATNMAGWKTCRSESLGFEVRYPPAWHVHGSQGTLESIAIGTSAGKAHARIEFFVQRQMNPHAVPIDQWLKNEFAKNHLVPPPLRVTTLGGREAVDLQIQDSHQIYLRSNGPDIFQIIYPSTRPEFDKLYAEVLSTLTFF